jgi:nucleoside-diphosphate-sugar epimerase
MWQWINQILEANSLDPVAKSLPTRVAMAAAFVMEGVSRVLRVVGIEAKPLLTRFLVSEMATSHYFSIKNAKADLGYLPTRTVSEALKSTFAKAA